MAFRIKRVAVLGAGVMGSAIAAHLANAGIPSFLLDIVPLELSEEGRRKGLTRESSSFYPAPALGRAPSRSARTPARRTSDDGVGTTPRGHMPLSVPSVLP